MLWFAVALGGSIGAMARYGVTIACASVHDKFPIATLSANILGSFLMGVCYVIIIEKALLPPISRQFLMVGCLGAFTTFSTFSIESLHLLQNGQAHIAALYAGLSFLGSLAAVFAGIKLIQNFI